MRGNRSHESVASWTATTVHSGLRHLRLRFHAIWQVSAAGYNFARKQRTTVDRLHNGATADPKQMEMQMLIVDTPQRPRAVTNSAERIDACRAVARQTATQAKESGSDTTGVDLSARAIEDRAIALLRSSSYHPVRHVSCEVNERVLILRGHVPNFHLKQIAQTVVRELLSDGLVIDNRLEVDRT